MTITRFQDLYDSFCAATGTERQHLEEDMAGVLAFSIEMRDVAVNVMHTPDTHPDSAFVLVDFGPPPEESQAEAFSLLLRTNFAMLGEPTASTFSIHPVYGNVTLQATYAFATGSGDDLLRAIRVLVDMALRWRESHFLEPAAEGGSRG